jgi:ABC-type uncharacterized transport system substrate-binding protein
MIKRPLAAAIGALGLSLALGAGSAFAAGQKILMIDSYHQGYAWTDDIIAGVKKTVGSNYDLKIVHMDTKRNGAEDAKKAAAQQVKAVIDSWKPDVVIAADDNSSKYVVVPFLKGGNVPVVFCAVNWDASEYGFPSSNVTGMLEVSLIPQIIESMSKFAKGQRVGFIGADNETDRKEAASITKKFGVQLKPRFVKTFDEWKSAYKDMQTEVDMLLVINNSGISGWDDAAAKKFTRETATIPSGSSHDFVAPFVLVTYAKLGTEQGEWAATTAIDMLKGKGAKEIPVTTNKRGQLYVNTAMADKLGVKFPLDVIRAAKVVKD